MESFWTDVMRSGRWATDLFPVPGHLEGYGKVIFQCIFCAYNIIRDYNDLSYL